MLLYFSATGNCKYVATRLKQADDQEMLSRDTLQTRRTDISSADDGNDMCGIPV